MLLLTQPSLSFLSTILVEMLIFFSACSSAAALTDNLLVSSLNRTDYNPFISKVTKVKFDSLKHVFDVVSQIRPVNTQKSTQNPQIFFMGLNVSPWHCRFLLAHMCAVKETGEGVYWLSGHCHRSQLE